MKKIRSELLAIGIVIFAIFAFSNHKTGAVKGTVTPRGAGLRAFVISATDSFKTVINDGLFIIPGVKPGTYSLVIEAKPPYKSVSRQNIMVPEDGTTDVGEIMLSQ